MILDAKPVPAFADHALERCISDPRSASGKAPLRSTPFGDEIFVRAGMPGPQDRDWRNVLDRGYSDIPKNLCRRGRWRFQQGLGEALCPAGRRMAAGLGGAWRKAAVFKRQIRAAQDHRRYLPDAVLAWAVERLRSVPAAGKGRRSSTRRRGGASPNGPVLAAFVALGMRAGQSLPHFSGIARRGHRGRRNTERDCPCDTQKRYRYTPQHHRIILPGRPAETWSDRRKAG